jgi:hypothetical protein
MAELNTQFNRSDLDTLIEAMGDWEMVGNQEFHALQYINQIPLPEEDDDSYEPIKQMKDFFRKREKEIKASRVIRQEKAVFLKAKLMLLRQDLGIDKLMSLSVSNDETMVLEETAPERKAQPELDELNLLNEVSAQERLEHAEYYIRDLGVWNMYQAYLAEKAPHLVEKVQKDDSGEGWHHG